MRENKYKAWDDRNGEWLFDGAVMSLQYSGESGSIMFDNDAMTRPNDSLVWVQYTGLKDKNGKEIYEGDIVSGETTKTFNDGINSFIASVEWDDSDTGFFYATDIFNVPYLKTYYADGIEVIGNIYENPELLEDA